MNANHHDRRDEYAPLPRHDFVASVVFLSAAFLGCVVGLLSHFIDS